MSRISIREQILNLVLLFMVQLPLVHRFSLFDRAFGFFYIGFLLLLPRTLSRSQMMVIAFFTGLILDVFTNTPGMHAAACVAVMFVRNFWLNVAHDDAQELTNLNMAALRKTGFLIYIAPLVFIHHALIFGIENGGLQQFGILLSKIVFSTIFSTAVIFIISFVIAPPRRRT